MLLLTKQSQASFVLPKPRGNLTASTKLGTSHRKFGGAILTDRVGEQDYLFKRRLYSSPLSLCLEISGSFEILALRRILEGRNFLTLVGKEQREIRV